MTFGPRLVDHADDAHRHPHLAHPQTVRQGLAAHHLADRVRQARPARAGRRRSRTIRSGVSASRSSSPADVPLARPRSRSTAFAATISGVAATSASAIARSAASLVARVAVASAPRGDLGPLGDRADLRGHVRLGCRLHRLVERRRHRTRVVPADSASRCDDPGVHERDDVVPELHRVGHQVVPAQPEDLEPEVDVVQQRVRHRPVRADERRRTRRQAARARDGRGPQRAVVPLPRRRELRQAQVRGVLRERPGPQRRLGQGGDRPRSRQLVDAGPDRVGLGPGLLVGRCHDRPERDLEPWGRPSGLHRDRAQERDLLGGRRERFPEEREHVGHPGADLQSPSGRAAGGQPGRRPTSRAAGSPPCGSTARRAERRRRGPGPQQHVRVVGEPVVARVLVQVVALGALVAGQTARDEVHGHPATGRGVERGEGLGGEGGRRDVRPVRHPELDPVGVRRGPGRGLGRVRPVGRVREQHVVPAVLLVGPHDLAGVAGVPDGSDERRGLGRRVAVPAPRNSTAISRPRGGCWAGGGGHGVVPEREQGAAVHDAGLPLGQPDEAEPLVERVRADHPRARVHDDAVQPPLPRQRDDVLGEQHPDPPPTRGRVDREQAEVQLAVAPSRRCAPGRGSRPCRAGRPSPGPRPPTPRARAPGWRRRPARRGSRRAGRSRGRRRRRTAARRGRTRAARRAAPAGRCARSRSGTRPGDPRPGARRRSRARPRARTRAGGTAAATRRSAGRCRARAPAPPRPAHG